jgi:universal stress protein A
LRIPTPLEEICDCTTEAYPDGSVFQAQRAWGKTEADSGSSVRQNARIACERLLRSSAKSAWNVARHTHLCREEILSMQLQKILAPIDFSDHASYALRWGASLAERYGAQILLLHVIPETVGEMSMHGSAWEQVIMALEAKVETQLFEVALMELKDGLRVDVRVAVGKPAEEIVRVAREDAVDLIVMGTHGHTGLHYMLLGSTAETVFRTAPCPVFMLQSNAGGAL